ncbi:MAG: nucleotidyltransferase family protein [Candidatus Methanospirareceae archaeon]
MGGGEDVKIEEIKKVISNHKRELKEKYKVKEIGIFGSFVRGEAKEESDVDILVEFEEPIGFFKFLELEEYLSNLIGKKVDLVSKKALKPHIGKYILEEVVRV